MDTEDLIDRLRQSGYGDNPPSDACADEHEIAGYVDGRLDSTDRERLERHLADCPRCTRLVGIVSSVRSEDVEPVPDLLIARARRVPARWKHYLPPLAAAATIILAVAMLMQFSVDRPAQDDQAVRTTRGSSSPMEIQVTAPSPGAVLRADDLAFHWNEVSGARYYIVRVVTASGELVTEQRVTTNEWRPGGNLALHAGQEYYVRVDAYPAVGQSSSSIHVPFSILGPS